MRTATLLFCCLAVTTVAVAQDQPAPTPPPAAPAAAPAPAAASAPAQPPAAAPLAAPAAPQVSEIKIVIEEKAKTDGELRMEFTPVGGAAKTIRVTIAAKMDGNDVARDLAKELDVALGTDYKVDRYDRDKIKVESKKKNATFSLTISALTANGLSVRLK